MRGLRTGRGSPSCDPKSKQNQEEVVMKHLIRIILATAVIIFRSIDAMAIEEAAYKVLRKDNRFEIRDYAPTITFSPLTMIFMDAPCIEA